MSSRTSPGWARSREVLERVEARGRAVADEVARLKRSGLAARLKRPEVTYAALAAEKPEGWPSLSEDVVEEVEVKYEGMLFAGCGWRR